MRVLGNVQVFNVSVFRFQLYQAFMGDELVNCKLDILEEINDP